MNLSIKVIILAGGASRRMGGGHKGSKPLNGTAMIDYVINILSKQHADIAINTNTDADAFVDYGYPIFPDCIEGQLGPLAGIYSAFKEFNSDYILTVPCDTPLLPDDLLQRMTDTLVKSNADVCTVSDGEHLHPVILLAHRRVMESLNDYLSSGERRVHRWFKMQNHTIADFSDQPDAFTNINTPEEFEAIARKLP